MADGEGRGGEGREVRLGLSVESREDGKGHGGWRMRERFGLLIEPWIAWAVRSASFFWLCFDWVACKSAG